MDRRSFLIGAGAASAIAASTAAGYWHWREITPALHYPGRAEGHFLRDRKTLPPPSSEHTTDIVILGSGIAGLTAAWKLRREGQKNFLMLDGPEAYGNAAGGSFGALAYPTGAHYLPLPSMESFHVREILHDIGVILRNPQAQKPYYDERFILHGPEERILVDGQWQEGVLPREGVAQTERDEQDRFFAAMTALQSQRGADGRRLFALPAALSSTDAALNALDTISFKQWLVQHGYAAPSLHWYADYCCRDDYGAGYDKISAWAGLHYFCSRGGEAENAQPGAWLTWPNGLQPIASALDRSIANRRIPGTAVSLKTTRTGVKALCFELINGQPRSYVVRARKAICAMPLFAAARVVESLHDYGFDTRQHLPEYAPWMVANFLVQGFPAERAHAPLSWDNVVYRGQGLGYVVSTHQDIRVAPPPATVFSAYVALCERSPLEARQWLETATPDALLDLAASDLQAAYGSRFMRHVTQVDITLRAHAMAIPRTGFRGNAGLQALRQADGRILFAHADLSGFSVFEEAAWWGYRAAMNALR